MFLYSKDVDIRLDRLESIIFDELLLDKWPKANTVLYLGISPVCLVNQSVT